MCFEKASPEGLSVSPGPSDSTCLKTNQISVAQTQPGSITSWGRVLPPEPLGT